MTVRETSRLAFEHLVLEGILPERRREVYRLIYEHGPGTSAEILRHGLTGREAVLTQSRARFTELRNAGLIQELGTVECSITGRRAILWDVTSQVTPGSWAPEDMYTRKPDRELLELARRAVSRLEAAAIDHADLLAATDARAMREELKRYG